MGARAEIRSVTLSRSKLDVARPTGAPAASHFNALKGWGGGGLDAVANIHAAERLSGR